MDWDKIIKELYPTLMEQLAFGDGVIAHRRAVIEDLKRVVDVNKEDFEEETLVVLQEIIERIENI